MDSLALFGIESCRQQSEQTRPDFPFHTHFWQLFWGDPETFPDIRHRPSHVW